MPSKPITIKQSEWLQHVKVADTSDGTLADYASRHNLSVKTLRQGISQLDFDLGHQD